MNRSYRIMGFDWFLFQYALTFRKRKLILQIFDWIDIWRRQFLLLLPCLWYQTLRHQLFSCLISRRWLLNTFFILILSTLMTLKLLTGRLATFNDWKFKGICDSIDSFQYMVLWLLSISSFLHYSIAWISNEWSRLISIRRFTHILYILLNLFYL